MIAERQTLSRALRLLDAHRTVGGVTLHCTPTDRTHPLTATVPGLTVRLAATLGADDHPGSVSFFGATPSFPGRGAPVTVTLHPLRLGEADAGRLVPSAAVPHAVPGGGQVLGSLSGDALREYLRLLSHELRARAVTPSSVRLLVVSGHLTALLPGDVAVSVPLERGGDWDSAELDFPALQRAARAVPGGRLTVYAEGHAQLLNAELNVTLPRSDAAPQEGHREALRELGALLLLPGDMLQTFRVSRRVARQLTVQAWERVTLDGDVLSVQGPGVSGRVQLPDLAGAPQPPTRLASVPRRAGRHEVVRREGGASLRAPLGTEVLALGAGQ